MSNYYTWRDLLEYLKSLEESKDLRLDNTITVSIDGEYYPADYCEYNGDDVLDEGHIVLLTRQWGEEVD